MKVLPRRVKNPLEVHVDRLKAINLKLLPFFGTASLVEKTLTDLVTKEVSLLRAVQNSTFFLEISQSQFFQRDLGLTCLTSFINRLDLDDNLASVLRLVVELIDQLEANVMLLSLLVKG